MRRAPRPLGSLAGSLRGVNRLRTLAPAAQRHVRSLPLRARRCGSGGAALRDRQMVSPLSSHGPAGARERSGPCRRSPEERRLAGAKDGLVGVVEAQPASPRRPGAASLSCAAGAVALWGGDTLHRAPATTRAWLIAASAARRRGPRGRAGRSAGTAPWPRGLVAARRRVLPRFVASGRPGRKGRASGAAASVAARERPVARAGGCAALPGAAGAAGRPRAGRPVGRGVDADRHVRPRRSCSSRATPRARSPRPGAWWAPSAWPTRSGRSRRAG